MFVRITVNSNKRNGNGNRYVLRQLIITLELTITSALTLHELTITGIYNHTNIHLNVSH